MAVLDTVIRNGTIVDGTGGPPFVADIGIRDGRIVAIGTIGDEDADGAREIIDATGLFVTPGFVDVHTHYDGQAIWDDRMIGSSAHGVTTVVTGNCGVGFAPCRADDRERLYALMEGVEDIPEIVMADGLTWDWESFPDYLDALERRPHDIDIAAQLPHSPLRVFTMGERGLNREAATEADLAKMRALTREAMEAGAIGFATSRYLFHRTREGDLIPSYDSGVAELDAIMDGMNDAGTGVVQAIVNFTDFDREFELLKRMAGRSGRPLSYTLAQSPEAPRAWEGALGKMDEANRQGLSIKGQIYGRPTGLLYGLDLSFNPFMLHPSFKAIAPLPLAEKVAILRDPAFRARLLAEEPQLEENFPLTAYLTKFDRIFPLGNPPIYDPSVETSVAAEAERRGVSPYAVVYDMLLEEEGHAVLFVPVTNYSDGNLDAVEAMLLDGNTILGLGDGGAHYGLISDSSFPTFMLTYWARDRQGSRFTLPQIVRKLSSDPADAMGLRDRGRIAVGLKADLNIIDFDRLSLAPPLVHRDLPADGRRLLQSATGYVATMTSGEVINRDGKPTGALPGRLVRGARPAPEVSTA